MAPSGQLLAEAGARPGEKYHMCEETLTAGPMTGWSSGSDSTALWIPGTGFGSTAGVHKIRGALEMRCNSGNCQIKLGYQLANDTDSPENAVTAGSFLSSEGFLYATDFTDISTATKGKLYIRFGFWVQNTSGSRIEMCRASLRVDIEG